MPKELSRLCLKFSSIILVTSTYLPIWRRIEKLCKWYLRSACEYIYFLPNFSKIKIRTKIFFNFVILKWNYLSAFMLLVVKKSLFFGSQRRWKTFESPRWYIFKNLASARISIKISLLPSLRPQFLFTRALSMISIIETSKNFPILLVFSKILSEKNTYFFKKVNSGWKI